MFRLGARIIVIALLFGLIVTPARADDSPDADKPLVAVFPLTGTADITLREHCNVALRAKLDRDGMYEPIAGVDMQDIADNSGAKINFDTAPKTLLPLVSDEKPVILIWGDLNADNGGMGTLRLKILDTRNKSAKPVEFTRSLMEEADFRPALEAALKLVPGVKDFEHPDEEEVHHSTETDAAFAKNPNLVVNGTFTQQGKWTGIYEARLWDVKFSKTPPEKDNIAILQDQDLPDGKDKKGNVLALHLSKTDAENNGLACLSDPIKIKKGEKYRITFWFKSDGPTQHVFVKGYTMATDIAGKPELREIYRRQISPSGSTHGQWEKIECDMSPQHITFPVQYLKVDLYTYLHAGNAEFYDIQLRAIATQTDADVMKDPSIKPPVMPDTQPSK